MGKRNDIFKRKYNELDHLCRAKFKMFRDANGEYIQKSAIYEYAEQMPDLYKEKLNNIIKLRNIIEHNDFAEANQNVINDLDMFINMIKSNTNPGKESNFELLSYKNHNIKKMKAAIEDLDLEDEDDIPLTARTIIEDRLYDYIKKLDNSTKLDEAKLIVKRFYSDIENIDDDPIIVHSILDRAIKEGIMEINDALNSALDELKNPFKRHKVKEIAERYIKTLKMCHSTDDIDNIDEIVETACEAIDDVVDY